MAARKNRRSKSKKQPVAKKSPLWLRDLLNIAGGLLVGSLGLWLVQEYLENREADRIALKYGTAVLESLPLLRPAAELSLAGAGDETGPADPAETLERTRALPSPDPFRGLPHEVCSLAPESVPAILAFVQEMQKAELLRKILEQQQTAAAQVPGTLSRELLRSVSAEAQLGSELVWKLKIPAEEDTSAPPPAEDASEAPAEEEPAK